MAKPATIFVGCAAPNFRKGRPGRPEELIKAVVIHIVDGSLAGCDSTFLDANLEVKRSAHYAVGKNGTIHEYVKEEDTAFHAGKIVQPTWAGLQQDGDGRFINPNFYTIGIEHEARANDEWTDPMYASSAALLRHLSNTYPHLNTLRRGDNIVMHREIRADKSCPGFRVDLDRLIAEAMPMASAAAVGGGTAAAQPLRIVKTLNIRRLPNTHADVVGTLLPGETVAPNSVTRDGERVGDNANWYGIAQGFIWAGGTDRPAPL